jgi:hypothetical protein
MMIERLVKWSLPLRAVAMVLFSLTVFFFLLGMHAALDGGPKADPLQAADAAAAQASPAPVQSQIAAPAPEPALAKVCVFNFTKRKGWAGQVGDVLRGKGFTTDVPQKYEEFSLDGSVVYFDPGYENQAKNVADASGVSPVPKTQPRPANVSLCPGGLALILSA